MSYRYEENDIVIDGWENGIAQSPYGGIANIRNADISVPGEVSVALKTTALTKPPTVSAVAFTVETTDILTVASTTGWYNGMAVTLDTLVDGTGLATGRVYWVGDLSGATFKLYKNPTRPVGQLVNVTLAGSGTISSYTLGKPIDKTFGQSSTQTYFYYFILDDAGRVWWIDNTGGTITNNLIYMGNDTLTGTTGRSIIIFKNHLIVHRTSAQDGIGLAAFEQGNDFDSAYVSAGSGGWSYGWNSISTATGVKRSVVVGQDDIMYYDNGSFRLASISENVGQALDLDDIATFTETPTALDFPKSEEGSTFILAELGTNLITGAKSNKIYPWDRISSSFSLPLLLPEYKTTHIVSLNNVSYIFAGFRGNIYVTNGSTVEFFTKIPDHITGKHRPYFTIKEASLHRNQILFSFTATENDGTAITGLDGVWAIDLTTGAISKKNELSHATSGTTHTISFNPLDDTPDGAGIIVGWESSTATYGVDIGSSNPYSGGETIIDSDIIPYGTHRDNKTPAHIEFKLSKPLVSGESIELQQRSNLTASFTSIDSTSTVGVISDSYDADFQNVEWIQIRVILTSTNTTPSFIPLREIRIVK